MHRLARMMLCCCVVIASSTVISLAHAEATAQSMSRASAQALVAAMKPQQGDVNVGDGLAQLHVPKEFSYYTPTDAKTILVTLWGNPDDTKTLGVLMPHGVSPLSRDAWAVVIEFEERGHIAEEDAEKIDYTALLRDIQASEVDLNKGRQAHGYDAIHMIGWAAPPHYDRAAHKLYWAKELAFGAGTDEHTLNYDIRVLGRRGVLLLNVVAGMSQLPQINAQIPRVLAMVDFQEGHRYENFNPSVDKVAGYGLAALIAGGVAAKTGMLKGLWIALIALKKWLVIGAAALIAAVKKHFGAKKSETDVTGTPPSSNPPQSPIIS